MQVQTPATAIFIFVSFRILTKLLNNLSNMGSVSWITFSGIATRVYAYRIRENFGGGKSELFANRYPQIATPKVYLLYALTAADSPNFSSPITFTCIVRQNPPPPPDVSRVRYSQQTNLNFSVSIVRLSSFQVNRYADCNILRLLLIFQPHDSSIQNHSNQHC